MNELFNERVDPSNPLIFVVSPCFGRYDLVDKMINAIDKYPRANNDTVVFQGGYSECVQEDRACVRQTIAYVKDYQTKSTHKVVPLISKSDWNLSSFKSGSQTTLEKVGSIMGRSYCHKKKPLYDDVKLFDMLQLKEDREWLRTLKPYYATDDVFISSETPTTDRHTNLVTGWACLWPLETDFTKLSTRDDRFVICRGKTSVTHVEKPFVSKKYLFTGVSVPETNTLTCVVYSAKKKGIEEVLTVRSNF